jgi:hypothetical protein
MLRIQGSLHENQGTKSDQCACRVFVHASMKRRNETKCMSASCVHACMYEKEESMSASCIHACHVFMRAYAGVGICLGRDASLVAGLRRNKVPGNLLRPQANIRVGHAKKKPCSTDM